MPYDDYKKLIVNAIVYQSTRDVLFSNDQDKIAEELQRNLYKFTQDEVEFLKTVSAKTLKDYMHQTNGFWR